MPRSASCTRVVPLGFVPRSTNRAASELVEFEIRIVIIPHTVALPDSLTPISEMGSPRRSRDILHEKQPSSG